MKLTAHDAESFERVIASGGIAIFPTDTLYGIACDPDSRVAADRIYRLKGRPPAKPSAVMFFTVERLLASLPELDERSCELIETLLPGPFTLVVANPRGRYAPACADAPGKLGLRVPDLSGGEIEALTRLTLPVMQTSANRSNAADAAEINQIDAQICAGVDLVLDGGSLPGGGSTVVDVSDLNFGRWCLLRTRCEADAERVANAVGTPPVP